MDYSLSAKEREEAFPIHIELGRKEGGMNSPVPTGTAGKKGRPRMFYPTAYIDGVPGLEKLPKKGCMLVEFVRKRISIEENADGKESTGVTIELHTLCLPEDMAEDGDTLEDALGDYGKSKETDDDEEDEDE